MHIRLFLEIISKIPENGVSGLKAEVVCDLQARHIEKVRVRPPGVRPLSVERKIKKELLFLRSRLCFHHHLLLHHHLM